MKSLSCLLLFTASSVQLFAQDNYFKEPIQPSPTAAALGEYGDIPVSHHTGVPNVSIPIYAIQEGEISLPISASYHSSGVLVSETASWIGLGWSLNAGGVITRRVMGAPDEGNVRNGNAISVPGQQAGGWGWYKDGGIPADLLTNQCQTDVDSNTPIDCQALHYDVAQGFIDTQPDIFSFYVGGISGKFYFNSQGSIVTVPQSDVRITASGTDFSSWTILSDNGTKYIFSTKESVYVDPQGLGDISDQTKATDSWYLSRMESVNEDDWIDFAYEDEDYGYPDRVTHTLRLNGSCNYASGSVTQAPAYLMQTMIKGKRLSRITTKSGFTTIDFNEGAIRTDLSSISNEFTTNAEAKVLANIKITTPSICKQFDFQTSYFAGDNTFYGNGSYPANAVNRLKLDWIQEKSCDGTITVPKNEFVYNSTQLPGRLSLARDHWGYYNGANTNQGLLPNGLTEAACTVNGLADRTPDAGLMVAGILTKIIYPTGGSSQFNYEPHNTDNTTRGGLRIQSIMANDGGFNPDIVTSYTYLNGALYAGEPDYGTDLDANLNDNSLKEAGYQFSSSPNPSLRNTQGYHVGYGTVIESKGGNGSIAYNYYNLVPSPFSTYPSAPTEQVIGAGNPQSEVVKNEGGNIISESRYIYDNDDGIIFDNLLVTASAPCYNCPPCSGPNCESHQANYFTATSARSRLISKETTMDGVETTTTHTYDPTNEHNNPISTTTTRSDGKTTRIASKYPTDGGVTVPTEMLDKNMKALLIDQETFVDNISIHKMENNYSYVSNRVLLTSLLEYKTGGNTYETYQYQYGLNGRMEAQQKDDNIKSSYLWGYNDLYPVVMISNADPTEVGYTGFEGDDNNVVVTGGTNSSTSYAGSQSLVLSAGASIEKSSLSPGKYIVSFAENGGSIAVSGSSVTIDSYQSTGLSSGWTLRVVKIDVQSGSNYVRLEGTGLIDEVRIFPADAQVQTYNYAPGLGMISQTDVNGFVTNFMYDELGRMTIQSDHENNILQTNKYHYANQ